MAHACFSVGRSQIRSTTPNELPLKASLKSRPRVWNPLPTHAHVYIFRRVQIKMVPFAPWCVVVRLLQIFKRHDFRKVQKIDQTRVCSRIGASRTPARCTSRKRWPTCWTSRRSPSPSAQSDSQCPWSAANSSWEFQDCSGYKGNGRR